MITVFFWPQTLTQASMCKLARYHGANSMIEFSTIMCISDELLRAIGASFQSSIPYSPYDLLGRIHDAIRHCNTFTYDRT